MKNLNISINWSDRTIVLDDSGRTQVVAQGIGAGVDADNHLRLLAAAARFLTALERIAKTDEVSLERYVATVDSIAVEAIAEFEATLC